MKKIICMLSVILLIVGALSFPAYADSAAIQLSKTNINPGNTVTVTVRYNAGFAMYAIDGTLTYNSSVLQYVSGGTNNGSSVKIVEGLSGETCVSYKVVFKAIAPGSGSLSFSAAASGLGDGTASAAATVNVTAPKPSANADLGSITLSAGKLDTEFDAKTKEYTATVKYGVKSITIGANAAVGDSTVKGVGTFDLEVGDNKKTITVTAASGAKSTYTINIRRLTEEETAAAEEEERKSNPLLILVDDEYRYIVPDLSGMARYAGYTLKTVERKGIEVSYFADNAGSYSLFWTTDENGGDGAFYNNLSFYTGRNDVDAFKRVSYLQSGDCLYIIKPFKEGIVPGSQFVKSAFKMGNETVECYQYANGDFPDFYVFYCYANGESRYYKYDALEGTVQREPTFLVNMSAAGDSENIFERFGHLSGQGKIVLTLFVISALLIFALVILLIVKAFRGRKIDDYENGLTIAEVNEPAFKHPQKMPARAQQSPPQTAAPEPEPVPPEFLREDDF